MTKENFNPDLNKFEVKDEFTQDLLKGLAMLIQRALPDNFRFSIFLFQEVDDQEEANIFYASSAKTSEALPLLETWCRRQVQ
jgi:hypothetical protein